ncbi:MAG: DUF11 domain-containing protein, partial [Chloroflexi bacterium]|nr:DUF11 domain-containing protein [Chloroflexota bacterium]
VSTRTYTITLHNSTLAPTNQVQMVNTLPPELTILPGSVTGNAAYDSGSHQLIWQGTLASDEIHQIVYQAAPVPGLSSGTAVTNQLTIHYDRHDFTFDRSAVYWIDAPDLTTSAITAVPNAALSTNTITFSLRLENSGLTATNHISTILHLPQDLDVLSPTLSYSGGTGWLNGRRLHWQGDLLPGEAITLSLQTNREEAFYDVWLPVAAVVQDGVTGVTLIEQILYLPAHKYYFPAFFQN